MPIEQKIKSLETSPLAAISSDDTIPKDFNELVKYYRSLIEQRDALNKTPEVIEAREKAELAPFYCGLAGITSMASLASGIVGYRLSRRKETN